MNDVRDQVWNQTWDQVWNQARNQVLDQVWNQARNQVVSQVQVRIQVWGQVRDQVDNQVHAQINTGRAIKEQEFLNDIITIIEEYVFDPDCSDPRRNLSWDEYITLAKTPGAEPAEGWHIDTGRAVYGVHESTIETYRQALRKLAVLAEH